MAPVASKDGLAAGSSSVSQELVAFPYVAGTDAVAAADVSAHASAIVQPVATAIADSPDAVVAVFAAAALSLLS